MVDSDDNDSDEEYEDNDSAIHDTLENELLRCENDILERDNFDDFVTTSADPDISPYDFEGCCNDNNPYEDEDCDNGIPTTDAGEFSFEVEDQQGSQCISVSGHVLLNQCGTMLTIKKH